jgi:hypothetical protein
MGILLLTPASSKGQDAQPNERQKQVIATLDLNRDGVVNQPELEAWLDDVLRGRLADIGASLRPDSLQWRDYIERQAARALNGSHNGKPEGQDSVEPDEVARLEGVAIEEPFGLTLRDLLPEDQTEKEPEREPWTDKLGRWLEIRQTFLDEASIGKPAKISLVNHDEDDETLDEGKSRRIYNIKASVILNGPVEWKAGANWYLRPVFGYEMNLESSAPAKDLIAHRVGLSWDYVGASTRVFTTHHFDSTFDFKTDRGYDASVIGATLQYTPGSPKLGIGRYLGRGKPVDFAWRPYVGLVIADVRDAGAVEAFHEMDDFTHLYLKLTGELKLGARVRVTPQTVLWRGERVDAKGNEHNRHGLHSIEARLILSESEGAERASLSWSATVGRDSPDFEKQKKAELALAFKF